MTDAAPNIELTDEGFILRTPEGESVVEWVHVAEIVAYRRDPAGADLLCLAFRLGNTGQYVEINEELSDYQQLLEHLYEAFPEITRHWWQDVTEGMGPNRITLYGLPASQQQQSSPAERYLKQIHQRKRITRAQWYLVGIACVAVLLTAGLQTFVSLLLRRWSPLLAMALFPSLLIVLVARRVSRPRTFFLLLIGFYLAEWLWGITLDRPGACLAGQLAGGKLSYLLLLGLEILLGMFAMLLPNHRAMGSRMR